MHNERLIRHLPRWYSDEASPYTSDSFVPEVTNYVHKQVSNGIDRLRIGKCILVGDYDIGKTSLIHKFSSNAFPTSCEPTIGVDFRIQKFTILNSKFQLNIWDTAGQERYKSVTSSFYRNSHAILLVFDMSRIATLSSVRQWHQEVMQIVVQREVQRLKHEFTFLTSCQRSAEISSTKSKQSSPTTPTKPSRTKKLKNKLSALNLKADPSTCTSSSTSSKISTTSNVSSKVAAIPPNRYVVEPFVFLVGTKRDQLSESSLRFVDSEAIKIANALKAEYWPVSALTGFNVPDLFGRVAALTFQEVTLSEIESQRDQPNVSSDRIDRYPNKNDDVVRLESSPKKRKSIRCMIRMVKLPKLPKIPKTLKAFTDRYMRSNKPPANVIIT